MSQLKNTGTVTVTGTGGVTVSRIQNWSIDLAVTMIQDKAENDVAAKGFFAAGAKWTWTAEAQDGTLPTAAGPGVTLTLNGIDADGNAHQLIATGTLESMSVRTAHEAAGVVTIGGSIYKSDGSFNPFTTKTGF
jgi:hypothetical protein